MEIIVENGLVYVKSNGKLLKLEFQEETFRYIVYYKDNLYWLRISKGEIPIFDERDIVKKIEKFIEDNSTILVLFSGLGTACNLLTKKVRKIVGIQPKEFLTRVSRILGIEKEYDEIIGNPLDALGDFYRNYFDIVVVPKFMSDNLIDEARRVGKKIIKV